MKLINYSVKHFVLNESAFRFKIETEEKDLTLKSDQISNRVTASILYLIESQNDHENGI
jgi:hypothetical protein